MDKAMAIAVSIGVVFANLLQTCCAPPSTRGSGTGSEGSKRPRGGRSADLKGWLPQPVGRATKPLPAVCVSGTRETRIVRAPCPDAVGLLRSRRTRR